MSFPLTLSTLYFKSNEMTLDIFDFLLPMHQQIFIWTACLKLVSLVMVKDAMLFPTMTRWHQQSSSNACKMS